MLRQLLFLKFQKLTLFFAAALIICLSIFPAVPTFAAGATMSVSPSSVSATVGKTFTVGIYVNAGQAINAGSGTITYSSNILEATSVSTAGSIFTFWTDYPSAGGSIKFGGGLPNPGHVGSGKMLSVTFKVKASGGGSISITGGSALANDGSGTNIFTGASGASVNGGGGAAAAPTVAGISISSKSHPSQSAWYKDRTVSLSWNKPSDVTSFSYQLSGGSNKSATTTATSIVFDDLVDGVSTFRLTGKSTKGDRTASFQIQIDNVAPEPFTVGVTQSSNTDPFPTFSYPAKDALSGIDRYTITIDGQEPKDQTESSFKADRQTPGTRTIKVVAFDKAGNTTEASTKFTVEGFPGPVISSISRFVSVLQPITLKGTALAQTKIYLFVNGKKEAEFITRENLTDDQKKKADASVIKDDEVVEWTYTYKGLLLPGKHEFYAVQIKPDTSESNPSNIVESQVLWSSLTIGGVILPMALIAIILLAILIILLGFMLWIARHTKRVVSGGWRPRLSKLQDKVDNEMASLKKDVTQTATEKLAKKPKELKTKLSTEVEDSIKKVDGHFDSIINTAEKEDKK